MSQSSATIAHPLAVCTTPPKPQITPSQTSSLPSPPLSPKDLEAARFPHPSPPLDGAYQQAPYGEQLSRQGTMSEDPLLLSSRLRTDDDLASLRQRKGTAKRLRNFYDRQNNQITALLKPMDLHIAEAAQDEEANSRAVSLSFLSHAVTAKPVCGALTAAPALTSSGQDRNIRLTGLQLVSHPSEDYLLRHWARADLARHSFAPNLRHRHPQRARCPPNLRRRVVPLALHLRDRHRRSV